MEYFALTTSKDDLELAHLVLDGSEFEPILDSVQPLAEILSEIFEDVHFSEYFDHLDFD